MIRLDRLLSVFKRQDNAYSTYGGLRCIAFAMILCTWLVCSVWSNKKLSGFDIDRINNELK